MKNSFVGASRLLITVSFIASCSAQATSGDTYELTRISPLADPDVEYARAFLMNDQGQVSGEARLAAGGSVSWFFDGEETRVIGDMSLIYPDTNSLWFSSPFRMNSTGQVLGYADDFGGAGGRRLWFFDGTSTRSLGLSGSAYLPGTDAHAVDLNDNGQAVGYQYASGLTERGVHSWFFDGTNVQRIGLTDADHTTDAGRQHSEVEFLGAGGHAVGFAERNVAGAIAGYSSWIFDGQSSRDISLGSGFTRTDGYRYSMPIGVNAAGQVAGTDNRYSGNTAMGTGAWFYDGASTTEIGLSGAEFIGDGGENNSQSVALNERGEVAGYTHRMDGGLSAGRAAWVYSSGSTREVGIATIPSARAAGWVNSTIVTLNEAGQVAGQSGKFRPGEWDLDQWTWFDDGASTRIIGLVDAGHTRADGRRVGTVVDLNDAGQVIGNADRFVGSVYAGQTAWFYDASIDISIALEFSVSSDGYAYSEAAFLGEDGLVLGSYDLFQGADFMGSRAFAWTLENGFVDLSDAVVGGLGPEWSTLESPQLASLSGAIMGNQFLANGPMSTWLLTPVPEPRSYMLMLAGLGLIGAVVKRRA